MSKHLAASIILTKYQGHTVKLMVNRRKVMSHLSRCYPAVNFLKGRRDQQHSSRSMIPLVVCVLRVWIGLDRKEAGAA